MKDDLKAGLGEVIAVHTTTRAKVIQSCGMHIHVSFNNSYTLNEVQRIAKAVVYFEDALFVPVARSRVGRGCAGFAVNSKNLPRSV